MAAVLAVTNYGSNRHTSWQNFSNFGATLAIEDDNTINPTTICDIPMECLEIILVKAYLLYFHYLYRKDEKLLFNRLTSVSVFWLETIARRRFKNFLHRHFMVYFSKISKRREITRNNRLFLREHINSSLDFIRQLQTFGCLTSEESKHIISLSSKRDRNDELYNVIRSFDNRWYLSFIACLRQSKQSLVAGVLEKGGVTVKLKLSKIPYSHWRTEKQKLVKSLNQLQNKDRHRTQQIEMQLSCLKRFDIEILGATGTKGIEVWFWCHSETGLQKLRQNQFVFETLNALFQCCSPLEKRLHVVDPPTFSSNLKQFERKVVTCPVTIDLQTRLHIATRQKQSILGATQLDDKIYALIKFPDVYSIRIYQDQRLIDEIYIEEITEPKCLSACLRTKCLYILNGIYNGKNHHERWSILKINPVEEDNDVVFSWLNEPVNYDMSEDDNACEEIMSLSVSSKAHLLLLKYDSYKRPTMCHLDVFTEDTDIAQPQRCFHPVAVLIKDPHHAVETAEEHFLISYGYRNESGIGEVTQSGEIIRYFHHFDPRDLSEPLVQPVYLEMGSYSRVLVACKTNSQVILVDAQLDTYEVLLTANDHGIDNPTQLSYCRDKKQLLVIYQQGKKIDVYCLSDTTL